MTKKDKTLEPADDQEAAQAAYMTRLLGIAETAEFESGTLVGDIRDTLMELFKNRQKPWSQMPESEQRDTARGLENVARTVVRKAVRVVAEEDLVSITGTIKGYSGKGGLFALKVEARGDEDTATELFRMDGHDVVIMSADHARFSGQKGDAAVEPDAPKLPFEADANADNSDLADAGDEEEIQDPPEDDPELQPEANEAEA